MTDAAHHSADTAPSAHSDLDALPQRASDLDRDRALLIQQIRATDDGELLWKLRELLSAHSDAKAEGHVQSLERQALRWHLESGVEAGLEVEPADALEALQLKTTPIMFGVSLGSLGVLGLILMLLVEPYLFEAPAWLNHVLWGIWSALVAVSVAEAAAMVWVSRRCERPYSAGFWATRWLAALLPPVRMGLHLGARPDTMWLPRLRWVRTNQALFELLRDDFAPMMIAVSLLVIPLLVVELRYEDAILEAVPWLPLFAITQTCQALIWATFAFEFVIMMSVYEDRGEYVQTNWVDAMIILFPLLSFLRLARVMQLARGYRLRVLLTRIRQAAILTRVLRRLSLISPPARQLARQRRCLRANHRERQEIEHMISTLVRRIEAKQAAAEALAARCQEEAAAQAARAARAQRRGEPAAQPPEPSA
jgi:voltage-gated potassium channel